MEKRLYRCLLEHSAMLECRPHGLAYRGTCLIKQDVRVVADNGELGISDAKGTAIGILVHAAKDGWVERCCAAGRNFEHCGRGALRACRMPGCSDPQVNQNILMEHVSMQYRKLIIRD